MTDTVPDGPTDPRLTVVAEEEESTTFVPQPGYVVPPMPSAPPGPFASAPEPAGGRVYSAGERSYHPDPDPDQDPGGPAPEPTGRGRTTVADEVVEQVVEKIVDLAAEQVTGVHGLHPGVDPGTSGPVSVRLDGDRAAIDIALQVEFGHPLHEVVENVRGNVISQSERLLGLTVTEVNVLVAEVTFDPEPDPAL